jgi:hypothetical protein
VCFELYKLLLCSVEGKGGPVLFDVVERINHLITPAYTPDVLLRYAWTAVVVTHDVLLRYAWTAVVVTHDVLLRYAWTAAVVHSDERRTWGAGS